MIYSFICLISWFGSLVVGILGICYENNIMIIVGFVSFFVYPIVYEILLNLKALLCKWRLNIHNCSKFSQYFPIVYTSGYNITACKLENLHPFDSCKYKRVFQYLKDKGIINNQTKIYSPSIPSREFLLNIMSICYLIKLNYSIFICSYIELPICFLPAFVLRFRLLNPMMRATQGSVDAACMAIHKRWAINLSGGYHHASNSRGGGFCIYPDITFVVYYLRKWHHISRIMIIDLDAHQGNGHERDFINDKNTFILDAYNPYIYPGDRYAKKGIRREVHVSPSDNDEKYLRKVREGIEESCSEFNPEFIIYNAGTDCMINDPLGGLMVTPEGIIQRDQIVFEYAIQKRQVPIVMLLSGGYQKSNAPVIAQSIENLIKVFELN